MSGNLTPTQRAQVLMAAQEGFGLRPDATLQELQEPSIHRAVFFASILNGAIIVVTLQTTFETGGC